MMKQFRYILTGLLFLGAGSQLDAATNSVLQAINFAVFGSVQETATNTITYTSATNLLVYTNTVNNHVYTNRLVQTYSTTTNSTVKTIYVNAPNVVKAIAVDLDAYRAVISKTNYTATANYLVNGTLYHKLDSNLVESIIIRKPHAGTNIDVDVTSFFGGPAAISNNFNSTAEIATSVESATGIKTNLVNSMNSIAFTSRNLSFSITNAFGTSFVNTLGTNRIKNLLATGAGTFAINLSTLYSSTNHLPSDTNDFPSGTYTNMSTNVAVVPSYAIFATNGTTNYYGVSYTTNVVDGVNIHSGPAHGTFSTTVGTLVK